MARLEPDATTSVELPLPTQLQAEEIIIAHLDYFRADSADAGSIRPFTRDALDGLIGSDPHPRGLLSRAAHVVLKARDLGVSEIDSRIVEEAAGGSGGPSVVDVTEGLDEAL